jgi:hypothetical protein
MLNSCTTTKDKTSINNSKNVVKISIKTQPGNDNNLRSTDDKKQISDVINYINALDLKGTSKDAGQYHGMSYIITVFYDDKKVQSMFILVICFSKNPGRIGMKFHTNKRKKSKIFTMC